MGMLDGKVIAITGASSGLGRAMSLRFAAEGARVAIGDIRATPEEGGEPTHERIGDSGMFLACDVSKWADVDALVGGAVTRWGRLDVIVNNAATWTTTTLLETTEAQWNRVMAVNVTGVFFGCKRAIQQFLRQEPVAEARGRIINISSQQGMVASPGDPAYAVSKGAVAQMTRQIAVDHARDLIVCNAIAPGKIVTGRGGAGTDEATLAWSRSRTPWPRLGEPRDVAATATFLASDMATYLTGVNLLVDGGWIAG